MAVGVDQAGNQRLALGVLLEIGAFGALVLAAQQRLDLALGVDDQPGEADQLAVLVEGDAVDIVDPRIGVRGAGEGQQDRKSVVEGKSVSVRVDIGVRGLIKKKNTNKTNNI